MTKPRVAISITQTWSIRNVIHSGVLNDLTHSVEPILLVRDLDMLPLVELKRLGIQVALMLGEFNTNGWLRRLRYWNDMAFAKHYGIAARRLDQWWRHRQRWRSGIYRVKYAASDGLVSRILSSGGLFRWFDEAERKMYKRFINLNAVRQQLSALRLDGFVSTVYFDRWEQPYLRTADDMGLATICMIPSFDNLWVWGMIPVPFRYFLVWHERMRDEVRMFYPNVKPGRCLVTGAPQFDFHVRPEWVWSREETARYWDLDRDSLWYLYTTNAEQHTPTEPHLLGEIVAAFKKACLLERGCLIIRPHPLDSYERWHGFVNRGSNVAVRYPWSKSGKVGLAQTDLSIHVAWVNLVRYSTVCMNVGSTTTLDAAAVGSPVVLINFAASGESHEDEYYKRFNFSREHYHPIACHPGLRVAHNVDDLIRHVRAYVADPGLDSVERERLAREFAGRLDGQSAKRVSQAIAKAMNQKMK